MSMRPSDASLHYVQGLGALFFILDNFQDARIDEIANIVCRGIENVGLPVPAQKFLACRVIGCLHDGIGQNAVDA